MKTNEKEANEGNPKTPKPHTYEKSDDTNISELNIINKFNN